MSISHTPSVDDLLKRGLRARADASTPDLLSEIVRVAEATPQRRTLAGRLGLEPRRLLLLGAIILLLAALAGAIAVGSGLFRRLSPDQQLSLLLSTDWSLDFQQSGISTEPQPGGTRLYSGLGFADGRLTGGTGYGAGCDFFDAPYFVKGSRLTTSLARTEHHCSEASAHEIQARLSQVASYALGDCDGPPVYSYASGVLIAHFRCQTLILFDGAGKLLLTYHSPGYRP